MRAVEVGQLWRSRDKPDNGRTVRVVVLRDEALNGYVTVENVDTGRCATLRRSTLTERYGLIEEGEPRG